MFDALNVSATGLTAERLRMDVTAENLANAQTTRGANGQAYRRKEVVLQEAPGSFGASLSAAMGGSGDPAASGSPIELDRRAAQPSCGTGLLRSADRAARSDRIRSRRSATSNGLSRRSTAGAVAHSRSNASPAQPDTNRIGSSGRSTRS